MVQNTNIAALAAKVRKTHPPDSDAAKLSDAASLLIAEKALLRKRLQSLLDYTGGSDIADRTHPIFKARKALTDT